MHYDTIIQYVISSTPATPRPLAVHPPTNCYTLTHAQSLIHSQSPCEHLSSHNTHIQELQLCINRGYLSFNNATHCQGALHVKDLTL